MRKVGTAIFSAVFIIVLMIAGGCRSFRPSVNLPELDAGKPFTQWDGIALTLNRKGEITVNGKAVVPDGPGVQEALTEALKAEKRDFRDSRAGLPDEWPIKSSCMTPVLFCADKDASLYDCLWILFTTCTLHCHDVKFAVRRGGGVSAVSVCQYFYLGRSPFCAYWNGRAIVVEGAVREVRVRPTGEGRYRLGLCLPQRWDSKFAPPLVLAEDEEPRTYATIEPLLKLIEEHKKEDMVVVLDFNRTAKQLKWECMARFLVRLEKTPIRGYLFVVLEVPY